MRTADAPLGGSVRDSRRALRLAGLSVVLSVLLTCLLLARIPIMAGGALSDRARAEVALESHVLAFTDPVVVRTDRAVATVTGKDIAEPEYLDRPRAERIDAARRSSAARLVTHDSSGELVALPLQGRAGGIKSLGASIWLQLFAVGIGAFVGGVVLAMRPFSPSARLYALLGALLYASGIFFSAMRHSDIATPLVVRDFIVRADLIVIGPFALGWFCLFLRFPAPLVSARQLFWFMTVGSAIVMATALTASVDRMAHIQMAFYAAMLVAVIVQFRLSRRDLSARRAMRVVGASVGMGTLLYLLVALVPMATGGTVPISEAVTMPLFVGIYAGIGVAILRNRRIVIDGWLRSVVVAIALACLALLVELAIMPIFGTAKDVARVAAFVIILAAYIPFRHAFVQKKRRERDAAFRRAFRKAAEVAFEDDAAGRALRWRSAVSAIFRPIEIEVDPDGVDAPVVDEGGLELHIPAFEAAPPLRLRYAQDGARIFDEDDADTVAAMIEVVEGLVRSRSAYARGASEERERIARDLHDDVSARLLSGLHRNEIGAMKTDIREAMGDIRAIVNGLVASDQTMGSLLADIRHEAASRLQNAGIELSWPIDDTLESPHAVTPFVYRHVSSIFRETFSNVIRHADATMVRVECALEHSWLTARMIDNGKGCETIQSPTGRGIGNCQNRAHSLNGHYRLRPSDQGDGCLTELVLDVSAG